MNPNQDTNEYITEIQFNVRVMLDAVDLGPPPQMIRAPSHHGYEGVPIIADGPFPNTPPNNFVIPEPCENCYTFSCNGVCIPPCPPPFTRMYTNAHLPYNEPDEELLAALSEEESKMRDEYEEAFFKELDQDKNK
jgi:hypothetical protein